MIIQGSTLNGATVMDTGIPIVGTNMLLYLDAGNPSSYPGTGTTWYDLSGNNNNTTAYGGTFPTYSSNNSGYFTFNASNYFQTSGSKYNVSYTGKTVFIAGKLSNPMTASTFRCLYGMGGTGSRTFNTYFYNAGSAYQIHYSAGGYGGFSPNLSYTVGNWFTLAVTQTTGGLISWYFNGILLGTTSSTFSQYASDQYEQIGASDNYWVGPISVVGIYGSTLSSAQVLQFHNAIRTRYGLS